MEIKDLFEEMRRILQSGGAFVLVSVIAGSGSTPRGAGARMVVRQDGTTMGTIGGGEVEYRASGMAMEVLRDRRSYTKGFSLAKGETAELGMICGGHVVIYFQYVGADHEDFLRLCGEIIFACERDEDSWLITDITDETAWSMGLYSERLGMIGMEPVKSVEQLTRRKAVQEELDGRRYYSEPLRTAGRVYIFGGGHVAQELVPLLSHIGFFCVVYDDREEFANPERFPQAAETIVGGFEEIASHISICERDYVVIMTRGHQCDYEVQRQVLPTPAHYIGVMGSKKKLAALEEKLRGDGFSEEALARFYGPIGLPIMAETPEEIAVSVAGQLIYVRATRK